VLVVGGGLSGLHTAHELNKQGIEFVLVEARERCGGRILSQNAGGSDYRPDLAAFDLGPSWFWQGQPYIEGLIAELNLKGEVFAQHAAGEAMFEDEQSIRRGIPGIAMTGAYRLRGGMRQLVAKLEKRLDDRQLLSGHVLQKLTLTDDTVRASVSAFGERHDVHCDVVVVAMPPRMIAQSIAFDPLLSTARKAAFSAVPTWMAGHAKLVAIYREPFWRTQGFSGDAISYQGPLGEIHDASIEKDGAFALFGFFNVPAAQREGREKELKEAAIEQLSRLFGRDAGSPLQVTMKDWARESYTATKLDQQSSNHHSINRFDDVIEPDWDGRLVWSGSEMAAGHMSGYLEGAIYSSVRAAGIVETISSTH